MGVPPNPFIDGFLFFFHHRFWGTVPFTENAIWDTISGYSSRMWVEISSQNHENSKTKRVYIYPMKKEKTHVSSRVK